MPLPQGLLPLLPLRNTVIFPSLTQILKVGRERSINALKKAEKQGFWIVAVQQKAKPHDFAKDHPVDPVDLHQVGTLCRIDSMKGSPEAGYQVVLRGMARVNLEELEISSENYLQAESTLLEDVNDMNRPTELALLESVKALSREILQLFPGNTEQLSELINSVDDLSYLTSLAAGNIDVDLEKKQRVLEIRNLRERVLFLLQVMQEFKEGLSVQAEIRSKLNQKFGQAQRQTILREQLKAIREELGEGDDASVEEKLHKRIEAAGMSEEVRKVAEREFRRLSEVGTQSPESHIIRNYLELLADLPWNKTSPDQEIKLDQAREIFGPRSLRT